MTRVGRLSGALIVKTGLGAEVAWYLVGNTKRPCEWERYGFVKPVERDAKVVPFVRLSTSRANEDVWQIEGSVLTLPLEGELAVALVADRLLVKRTGSVSERLWRLIFGVSEDEDPPEGDVSGDWFASLPRRVWDVVEGAVLKCT